MTTKQKIQSLITKANQTTGGNATDLTTAVNALAAGYGQGGSQEICTITCSFDALPKGVILISQGGFNHLSTATRLVTCNIGDILLLYNTGIGYIGSWTLSGNVLRYFDVITSPMLGFSFQEGCPTTSHIDRSYIIGMVIGGDTSISFKEVIIKPN